MPITFQSGDLFAADVEAIVNPINCVGVMGKGIALEVKKRNPSMFYRYRQKCSGTRGDYPIEPGDVVALPSDNQRQVIFNMATKDHWRQGSRIEWIEQGLLNLQRLLSDENQYSHIQSLGLPPVGCGNGGLEWSDVKPLVLKYLDPLPVNIICFEPDN